MESKYSLHNVIHVATMYGASLILAILKQWLFPSHMHMHAASGFDWHMFMMDFMGFMFLISAVLKFMNLRCFVNAYVKYDLISQQTIWYAWAYPFIELGLGIAYLLLWQETLVIWITLLLMLSSSISVAWALYTNADAECGCMGTTVKMPLSIVTLIENLFMFFMAVMMLWM